VHCLAKKSVSRSGKLNRAFGTDEQLYFQFFLERFDLLIGIVDDERERETVLETAKRTKPIRHAVDFLLLPEPGYEKLLLHRKMSGGNRPSETRIVLAGTRSIL
jgi:hypothetical protein